MFDAITGIVSSIVNFVAEKLGLDFRLGEDEVSKKERELNEIREKKAKLENRENKLEETLSARQKEIAQLEAKLEEKERKYVDYLDEVAEGKKANNMGFTIGEADAIDRLDEKIKKLKGLELEEREKLEEEKRKLLLAEKELLFDMRDFVSGSMNYSPSGNGAAQGISAQMLYEQDPRLGGSAPMNVVTTDNGISVNNTMNDFGGAQRVEPASRYVYSEAVYP